MEIPRCGRTQIKYELPVCSDHSVTNPFKSLIVIKRVYLYTCGVNDRTVRAHESICRREIAKFETVRVQLSLQCAVLSSSPFNV